MDNNGLPSPDHFLKDYSTAYGDLFRLGSDIAGLDDSYLEPEAIASVPPDTGTPACGPEELLVQPVQCTGAQAAADEPHATADLPQTGSAGEDLTRRVQEELMLRCGRQRGRVIEGLRVHVAGGTAMIICATIDEMDIVQHEMVGAMQRILVGLGAPSQMIFTTRAGWEARSVAGNARSRTAPTNGLPSSP